MGGDESCACDGGSSHERSSDGGMDWAREMQRKDEMEREMDREEGERLVREHTYYCEEVKKS